MGRIKKTASERHMATLSPFVKEFVKRATEASLHLLPGELASFPQKWPLPRGDLYHWIPLLDRFDNILHLFNTEYKLNKGPQQEQFQRRLLKNGDDEGADMATLAKDVELDALGYSTEGDRDLVEAILQFTRILLEHCGNRSLYASSSHIGDLMNTTSLSLLRHCLKLSLRLAQRYQVARYKNHHPSAQALLLANHYSLNLDNLHKIAQPFPKPQASPTFAPQTPGKGKEKQMQLSTFNPADLNAVAKQPLSSSLKSDMSCVTLNYYDQPSTNARQENTAVTNEASPATPTPIRRASNLGPSRDRPSAVERSVSSDDILSTPSKTRNPDASSTSPKVYQISAKKVVETPAWALVKEALPNVPDDLQYDLLNRIRIAKAFASVELTCQELLEVRLLAIANLTYAYSEAKFQDRIGIPDAEEPRRFHLAQQLCDLLQPATGGQQPLTLQTETAILMTLEALTKSRHKVPEVTDALAITVNHGLLYYELRKVMATLGVEEHADAKTEFAENEWREATFDLINSLVQMNSQARYGEKMVAAGIIEILVEALSLRTSRAERFYERILQFFDGFIHGIPTAFQTLANAKGLDIIAELTSFEVETALHNARNGKGLPDECKSKVVDYDIPFYQQSTLRQLFKNTVHMFEHNAGTHDRLLRNLIDTPQILGALRTVIENAHTFGSNVWSGAVNIISNFIHNEPTSYQVIGEAGLSKALLESIINQTLPDDLSSLDESVSRQGFLAELDPVKDGKIQYPSIDGILPVGEVMIDIPNAFGAICLSETGMQLFQASKALVRYFDIFLSPRHVQAMEDEGQTAQAIGQAFDELSRHHPRLKDQIMGAVLNMLRRLRQLCKELAEYEQAGAKLWERSDGALSVAGGRAALKGATTEDYDRALHQAAVFAPASQTDPLPDSGEEIRERAPAINYLSACFKFLEGFFHNSTMCSLFADESGTEIVLDLAMSPSNPHDLVAFQVFSKITQVLKNLCEAKPHLVLPSLIRRTQFAILGLKDLMSNDSPQSSFLTFTDLSSDTKSIFANGLDGTSVVKSLVNTHILTHVLGRTLAPPTYTLRHANHQNPPFNSLNFTDIYMDLVDTLGKLHAACVWENLMLQRDLLEEVQRQTEPRAFIMRRVGANDMVDIPTERERLQDLTANTTNGAADDSKKPDHDDRGAVLGLKNISVIRYLLSQVPMGIDSFFSSLGQAIVTKRIESSAKQHAGLIAERLAQSAIWELDYRRNRPDEKVLETKYVTHILTLISHITLRNSFSMEPIGTKEALTLVLHKFYLAGGFAKLNEYLERFVGALESQPDSNNTEGSPVREAIGVILHFYGQIVRSKCISDANQSNVIRVADRLQADFFLPGQFLVEIRDAVLPAVRKLWQSQSIDKFSETSIKSIVEILRVILKGEGEDRALRRHDNLSRRVADSRIEFSLQNQDGLEQLSQRYETILAREAVYRCNNHESNAEQYCRLRQGDNRVPRFPIPEGEAASNTVAAPDQAMAERNASAVDTVESDATQDTSTADAEGEGSGLLAPMDESMSDDENMGSLGTLPAELQREDLRAMIDPDDYAIMTAGRGRPTGSSRIRTRDTHQMFVTVDDLEEKRKEIREDLIDRCLDVLSSHRYITFELADLIQAAVAKTGEATAPRADIGTTLVQSLMSLQGEESDRDSGHKIHAYAHLVALILQERDFFDSMLDELKEYFDSLVNWVQLGQDQKIDETPWVETVLLIIERVLAEDEQPPNIDWSPPPAEDPLRPLPKPSPRIPVVSESQRSQLLDAMVDILPKIGKNSSLALSVCRVLVVLTRHRALATRLSERQNMGRLFLMIRQLAGAANENKLQSSFMLILRHMVEDDNTVRQLMRAEIRAAFENPRSGRAMDTTAYSRTHHHLALRNYEIFVEVTEELLEISRYDGYPNRAQTLGLKDKTDTQEDAEPSSTTEPASKTDQSESRRQSEAKLSTVENTDGVVQFLLRELSNYKDVDEKPVHAALTSSPVQDPMDEASPPDIEMRDVASAAGLVTSNLSENKAKQNTFKPEEHAIYIYRCFLMQCLAELVACYNRTKIEFINFSRRSEVQPSTPSKPRSGTLNYLLNTLLPVGTLEHKDDVNHRKKVATSQWATNVLVSLCTKTQERFLSANSMWESGQFADKEPELTFVRRFVLEHALRAFKDATSSTEALDVRYSRLLALGELFNRMLNGKVELQRSSSMTASNPASHQQVGRLMYEKNFIGSLTSAIAELDLNFPHAKRAVKYILGPLKQLTDLGVTLSQTSDLSSSSAMGGTSADEEDISSATSISDEDEADREQTPDLFRGSSLGMFETSHGHDDEDSDSGSDEDEDDEMYEDGYDEEMEYDDEPVPDHGDVVSDEDDELNEGGEMQGYAEGVPMEIDVMIEDEVGSDDEDDDEEADLEDIDDDEDGDEDHEFEDQIDEIAGDDENASMADHDDEGDWEDDGIPFEDNMDEHDAEAPFGDLLEPIAQVLGADVPSDVEDHNHVLRDGVVRIEMENGDGEFFEDEMAPEDDEDEDDEAGFDAYEPEIEDDEDDEQDAGWGWDIPPPPAIVRGGYPLHHHHRNFNEMLGMLGADPIRSGFRTHRSAPNMRDEDGINPLLQRENGSPGGGRERETSEMPFPRFGGARRIFPREETLQNIMAGLGAPGSGGVINVNMDGNIAGVHPLPVLMGPGRHGQAHAFIDIDPSRPLREQIGANFVPGRPDTRMAHGSEEAHAVDFRPNQTSNRWQEEARMLFPGKFHEKATNVISMLLRALVPRAMEAKRIRDKEEEERKAALAKAAEEARQKAEAEKAEREAQDKKEREEREAQEQAEAEVRAREEAERTIQDEPNASGSSNMEGVEQETQETSAPETQSEAQQPDEQPAERVTINIRGNELDITTLGIDRDFLAAIPEDMWEEVIMQQYAEQRSQAARSGEQPTEISREFLEALPQELQEELLQNEAQDRRNRERAEARRRATQENSNNAPVQPEELNNADFMAMLEPALRQAVLREADDTVLAALPEEFQAEARALFGDRRPRADQNSRFGRVLDGTARVINSANNAAVRADDAARDASRQRRPVIQMLDKAGVATLLRLMFVSLHHKAKVNLHGILSDVCKNTQNRAEVISILLSILQDGTADASAIERSFAQLSLRAKQPTGPKTPQATKRGLPDQQAVPPSTDLSPLNIVQQCLGSLNALCNDNPRVPSFFLNEHETAASQKAKTPKKGKNRESRAVKFPLNALLTLLDRKLVIENTAVMETLASLLSHVTHPLTILLRRAKEAQEADRPAADPGEGIERPQTSTSDVPMADVNAAGPAGGEHSEPVGGASIEARPPPTSSEAKKKHRDLTPPEVPEENIRLVVNILAARECPSKTFSDTLDIIKNLSAIPGAKEVFGKELIRQAQELGQNLLIDLEELAKQIDVAKTGTDLQGMALANFSSAGSKQRKLLRVLVALDHLFDPKRTPTVSSSTSTATGVEQKLKDNILATLYENASFEKLWNSLSICLAAIRRRGNMVNVATILLPLIESLMVVCRNCTAKENPSSANVSSAANTSVSTPPPETRMERLFFVFTEEHRKILNELIRNNPKLMNGNLSVLAKNSKVLEFDNKRNYFGRKLHDRRAEVRISQPTLQLSVRRNDVFLDSFKSLFHKSGDEIKYGKLNIRFHGEEGIDAGGVSREWFGAMARQMFDPNYALFNPVASDRTTFHPNSLSEVNPEHLMFFKFIGRIIGKALYENRVLDCHFSRAVYRRILGKSVSLKDMESLDLDYYKSLTWILENDITDVTFETFSIDVDRFGSTETFDLVDNGRNIPVTEDNKHDYVRLVVEFRLIKSVQEQLDNFLAGFHEIIPAELVSIFDEQELELLISGLPDIDVDDWKNNTEYHNYQPTSPQIQWFWRAVRSFDQEEKAKLLQFVTGTSKVPLNGFKELEGMNGFAKFNIHRDYSSKEKLPSSHTCFNQLDLPEYESYEHLRHQLYTAITAGSEYFGFA